MNLSTLLLAALAAHPAAAKPRATEPPASIELAAARRDQLDRIEIETQDPRQMRSLRRAVTDIAVSLLPGRVNLAAALAASGGTGIAAERRLFRARILVVSGGRLNQSPLAWCGGFIQDTARCDVDCDGGGFALRRTATSTGFVLIVGGNTDEGGDGAISLTACAVDASDELRLVARRSAGRAEISLESE